MKILYIEDNQNDIELTTLEFKKNAPHIEIESIQFGKSFRIKIT